MATQGKDEKEEIYLMRNQAYKKDQQGPAEGLNYGFLPMMFPNLEHLECYLLQVRSFI